MVFQNVSLKRFCDTTWLVAVNPGENQAEQDKLKKMLADDWVDYQEIYSETLTEKYKGKKETESVTLMVTDKENFEPFISMESPDNQQKLSLKDGVVVSINWPA